MKFFKKSEQDETIDIVFHTQKISDLPLNIENKTLAIASNYHFIPGHQIIPELSVQKINEQNPDIVLLLGDFITSDPEGIEELAAILKKIKAKDGVFAIYGNHDIKRGELTKQRVGKALTEIGNITILENQQLWPWGKQFTIIGLGDLWSPKKKDFQPEIAFNNVATNIPRIVLAHNPDSIFGLQEYRADLILSGHTHGIERKKIVYNFASITQILPDFMVKKIPLGFLSDYEQINDGVQGVYQLRDQTKYKEGRQLIITSGLGSHDGSKRKIIPELMFIKLQRKV